MNEIEITLKLEVKDALLLDLLTAAVEGGSHYWLACNTVERDAEHNVTKIVGCQDVEDEDTKWGDLDIPKMREGVRRILANETAVRPDIRAAILTAILDVDAANWDAETADCVVQAALFNELVYG